MRGATPSAAVPDLAAPAGPPRPVSLAEALPVWLRVAALSFGGATAPRRRCRPS
ncbi:hypothetical protein [Methylobacterium sp. WSM2598]|uniref:hypothetical protein n=1 Tax=Methylobacterium sp. WSM2598 TaxID=398261 RepID=UPI00037F730D|nr:hypothetical protein [Methylobacterium sp. WSM2598]